MASTDDSRAGVLADPDDDDARRVWADDLQRAGDPRGELIALSCEAASAGDGDPRRRELERAEVTSLRRLLPAWCERLAIAPNELRGFARGTPDHLRIAAKRFRALAPRILGETPLRALVLDDATPQDLAELARSPAPPMLRALRLLDISHRGTWDADSVRTLATAPWLSRLGKLGIVALEAGDQGVAAQVAAGALPGLAELDLESMKLSRKGLAALLAAPGFARMTALELYDVRLGTSGARVVAASRDVHRLRKLSVSRCGLTDEDMQRILDAETLPGLERLSLRENQEAAGSIVVGEALARTLRRLDLGSNGLDDDWARAFVRARPLALTHLELRASSLSADGVRAIVEAPHLAALRSLDIQHPYGDAVRASIGAELPALVAQPAFARLRAFYAAHCRITTAGAVALAGSPHVANLSLLVLSDNPIGPDGARAIAASPHLRGLTTLDLDAAALGDDGIIALCAGDFPCLRHLGLANNNIGARGYAALLATRAFPQLRTLTLFEATDPAQRVALETHLGALVNIGDHQLALGFRSWTD